MPGRFIDLHTHSTASDGTLAPDALARAAAQVGLAAFALTDHDTTGGLAAAQAAADEAGVRLVPGLELSLAADSGELHLLAYFVDPAHARLVATLGELRTERERRVPRMVSRLEASGVHITVEDVHREAGIEEGRSLGRPHVAHALIRRGHARDVKDAFDRYLALGRPGYVPKRELAARDAISLVRSAGGVAVLAHPFTIPAPRRAAVVREMARLGIVGVEVDHPKHDAALRRELAALARELDLVATGGTDFHGATKPDIALGTGRDGNVRVPEAVLDLLNARRA